MNRLEKLSAYIFPSDPAKGYIGSIDLNIWLAQIAGIPLVGLKHESLGLKIILLCYGTLMTIFVTFLYTGFEMYDLMLCWRSLDSLTQNTCLSLTHLAGVTKILNSFYRFSDIRSVIENFKLATMKYVVTTEQRKAFYRGEFENKLPFAIYATLVSFTGFLGMIMLFYDPANAIGQFPYRVKLPASLKLELQLIYMGVSVLLLAMQIVAIDYLNVILINQIRFQLRFLNLSFSELSMNDRKQLLGSQKKPFVNQRINLIIEHHWCLLDLRNQIEDIFRMPVLVQFFTSVIIFALTGFQATVRSDTTNGTVLIYFYCCCIFCELFIYCWCGNDVFEQSKTLSTTGYSCIWYKFDQRFKKSLQIFLINAQKPFMFSAGGFMTLSLPSFAGILTKSYSYIAVLRQLYSR